jgi:intraflagellar transport protein 172
VKALCFSPDSSKIAVAQSDNIVFVYKLGLKWGEKKSICNKFPQTTPVTCICWPSSHSTEFFLGLAEGKVKQANLRNNKSAVIYSTDEYVVSLCSKPDGTSQCAGHIDGSIYIFSVTSTGSVQKVASLRWTRVNDDLEQIGATHMCSILPCMGREYHGCGK